MDNPTTTGEQEIIERIAIEVMGWENVWCKSCKNTGMLNGKFRSRCDKCASWRYLGLNLPPRPFNPLQDHNHWRQVEEKIMEDGNLWYIFQDEVANNDLGMYMRSDLPTRCKSLISVLDTYEK